MPVLATGPLSGFEDGVSPSWVETMAGPLLHGCFLGRVRLWLNPWKTEWQNHSYVGGGCRVSICRCISLGWDVVCEGGCFLAMSCAGSLLAPARLPTRPPSELVSLLARLGEGMESLIGTEPDCLFHTSASGFWGKTVPGSLHRPV